ncbi:MAG: hypothetical protein R2865_00535 [Deinococcales bacterium]
MKTYSLTQTLKNFTNNSFTGWTPCANEANILISSNNAHSGTRALLVDKPDSCFYQSVRVNAGDNLSLSCFANITQDTGWSGMGLSFSNGNWQKTGEAPSVTMAGNTYKQYQTTGTAPNNSQYASVWFYTSGKMLVDNCSLAMDIPPAPTSNYQVCELQNNSRWGTVHSTYRVTTNPTRNLLTTLLHL